MDQEKQTVKVSTRRWVKVLLALSLTLNMLVIGTIGGAAVSFKRGGGPHSFRDISYGPYSRALSHADRKEIGAALRREAGAFRGNMPKMRAAYQALLDVLQADEYDRSKVHELVRAQQEIGLKRQEIGLRLLLERLDSMTNQQRQKFAKRLKHALKRLNG